MQKKLKILAYTIINPNGDLIVVSLDNKLKDYKIYLYPFKNKSTLWEYSQIYDIEIPESLSEFAIQFIIYEKKLFILNQFILTQWDLSKMAFEMQYNLVDQQHSIIVINKNQTLLALHDYQDKKTDIYSMETGVHISRCG